MSEKERKELKKKEAMLKLLNLYEQNRFYPNVVVASYILKIEAELVKLLINKSLDE